MTLGQFSQDANNTPAELAKGIEDTKRLVQHLSTEIRTTSYLLHPPLLDEAGLSSALDWYVQGLKERSGLDVSLTVSEKFERLPSDMELVIFRVVQESLTNVLRHSGSKTASVRVSRDADRIVVEVQDKGRGISADRLAEIQAQGSGVGIGGMRERLRHLKGELLVESNATGTLVTAVLPSPTSKAAISEQVA
jgi:signal transduction histidine kinase